MPKRKRVQREHTEDWQTIQHYTRLPGANGLRVAPPCCPNRAIQRFNGHKRQASHATFLERKADRFDEQGMVSLFASRPR